MTLAIDPRRPRRGMLSILPIGLVVAVAAAGCGKTEPPAPAAGPQAVPSAPAGPAAAPPSTASLDVCGLLPRDQLASVIPGHDGGSASGDASLLAGVKSLQCNVTAARGNDVDLLTLVVSVASTDALMEQIRPSGSAFDDQDKVAVGDGGWIKRGAGDEVEIVASKGRSVLRLTLLAPGASARADAMVALAAAVAARL
jgi:hypothetical protein